MEKDFSKKKIMFVTGSITGGGAEKVITLLANGCAEAGAQVSLAILRERQESYTVSDKVRVFRIKTGKFKLISRLKGLRQAIKESDADTLVPFLSLIAMYTLVASVGLKKRYVLSENGDPNTKISELPSKDRIAKLIMGKMQFIRVADRIVFQTPDAQSYYCKAVRDKSEIIPNPLDCRALPNRYTGEREKRIIAAGRLSEEKNFPLLLSGFAEFLKTFPDYTLTICGEGAERKKLTSLAAELGIADKVSLPGFCEDIHDRMHRAAMYVSTSNHEGISNSMLEALGMGVPTIVTDCPVGGAGMFVRTDETGILIPMNDEEALVAAMIKIASDKEYADRVSAEAEKVREELSSENICRRWMELC